MHGLQSLLSLFELRPQLPSLYVSSAGPGPQAPVSQCGGAVYTCCLPALARAQPAAVYRERAGLSSSQLTPAAGSLTASESRHRGTGSPGNPGTARTSSTGQLLSDRNNNIGICGLSCSHQPAPPPVMGETHPG